MILPRHSDVAASSIALESRLSDSVLLRGPFISSAHQLFVDYRMAPAVARRMSSMPAVVVGRGSSSLTEATELSGVGVPELCALMEAEDAASLYGKPVVCGLGVETAASAVKALAAGAGAVVLHKLTPETTENAIRRMREQVCERLRYVGVQTISELHEKAEFIHICPHVL